VVRCHETGTPLTSSSRTALPGPVFRRRACVRITRQARR
jgi:hypothetical protein